MSKRKTEITQSEINNCINYMTELKYNSDNNVKFNIKKLIAKHSVRKQTNSAIKRLKYMDIKGGGKRTKYIFKIDNIEPIHARNVIYNSKCHRGNSSNVKGVLQFKNQLAAIQINKIGKSNLYELIKNWQKNKDITKKQAYEIRYYIKNIDSANNYFGDIENNKTNIHKDIGFKDSCLLAIENLENELFLLKAKLNKPKKQFFLFIFFKKFLKKYWKQVIIIILLFLSFIIGKII